MTILKNDDVVGINALTTARFGSPVNNFLAARLGAVGNGSTGLCWVTAPGAKHFKFAPVARG